MQPSQTFTNSGGEVLGGVHAEEGIRLAEAEEGVGLLCAEWGEGAVFVAAANVVGAVTAILQRRRQGGGDLRQ